MNDDKFKININKDSDVDSEEDFLSAIEDAKEEALTNEKNKKKIKINPIKLNINKAPKKEETLFLDDPVEEEKPREIPKPLEVKQEEPMIIRGLKEEEKQDYGVEEVKPKRTKKPKRSKRRKKTKKEKVSRKEEKLITEEKKMSDMDLRIKEKQNKLKQKKLIMSIVLFGTMFSLFSFGIYATFFKDKLTFDEIAVEVNKRNLDTPFNSGAELYSYMKENVDLLVGNQITLGQDISDYSISKEDLFISKVDKLNTYFSNIHFSTTIKTSKGENKYNFIVPLKYDFKEKTYNPAGNVTITESNPKNSIKEVENNLLSFSDIGKETEEQNEKARSFVNNFFIALYNNKDIDLSDWYFTEEEIGNSSLKFDKITEFNMYTETNKAGYNVKVEYLLSLEEGLVYNVVSYMKLELQNGKLTIISIL